MATESLMTARQVASYLNCSATTVRRMATRGQIPHYRLGKLVRFRRGDVEAWLARVHRGDESGSDARSQTDTNQLSLFSDDPRYG